MKHLLLLLSIVFLPGIHLSVDAKSLDELYREVKQQVTSEKQEYQQREEKFKSAKQQQQQLLSKAEQDFQRQQNLSDQLRANYEANIDELDKKKGLLKERAGTLGELNGIVRQIASDLNSIINNSLITAEFPERGEDIDKLTNSKELPSIKELEKLWLSTLQEMTQSAKVSQFDTDIINSAGEVSKATVTRVGTFNVVNDGRFLRYLSETQQLVEPAGQPHARVQTQAREFESSTEAVTAFPIDPTRGSRLALYVLEPSIKERIQQGGIVGYIIIAVGILGVLMTLERFIVLTVVSGKMNKQLKSKKAGDNPLGRIMKVYESNPDVDTETLEYKLDEAILKEVPSLQRRLSLLALLAAIAPLLGLLGTVTGIIETFQSITLFGTGDPRTMSDGISQALVTTVMGLVVAIPLLLFHSFLSTNANRLLLILDEKSKSFVALLAEINRLKQASA